MIRARTLKRIKIKTPGGRNVIHFRKKKDKKFKILPKIKREILKQRVRK
ncbi:MAG: hypothetical protein QXD43_04240 [Candidatus Aenigmatarchaeota archaeon]